MNRWTLGLPLGLVGVLLAGCPGPDTQKTETPDGPSELNEDVLIGSTDDEPAEEVDPELAAKQAAAKEVLEKVKDRDPEEERKKLERSHAISQQAQAKLTKGQYTDAVKTARQALKVHEQNVDAMLVFAEVYYKEGKFELVRAVTSSALQIDAKIRTPEETSRAYNLQGFAMLAMGEDQGATRSFKKAAEVDEKNAAAWNNLGTRYLDVGDVPTATACFEYAIELEPRFYKAHLNYGAALRASRNWEAAEAAMRKALELRPNYPEAYFNLGVLYLDADPFPGLDTTQRLNKVIGNLSKFQKLAVDDDKAKTRAGTPGLAAAGANAPPPRVSKARAEDFIRVAKKGLEKEGRRLDRAKEREAKNAAEAAEAAAAEATAAEAAAAGGEAGAPTEAGAETPGEGGATDPAQPSPQGPNQPEPASPTPQGPQQPGSGEPAEPTPSDPAPTQPAKPTPTQPAKPTPTQPAKPTPTQPAKPTPTQPAKPAPTQPAKPAPTQPAKPAPTQPAKPAPTQPAKPAPTQPAKPAPTQPAKPTPAPPPAQKPSPQKPQSASLRAGEAMHPHGASKKLGLQWASRGTRSTPSTLNSMEAGVVGMSRVDYALVRDALGRTPDSISVPTWFAVSDGDRFNNASMFAPSITSRSLPRYGSTTT
ncbi:MAG: tetratricopeptide repeat protein [Myxococcota bacterium]